MIHFVQKKTAIAVFTAFALFTPTYAGAAPIPGEILKREKDLKICLDTLFSDVLPLYESLLKKLGVEKPSDTQVRCALENLWFDAPIGGNASVKGEQNFTICCSNVSDHEVVELILFGVNWESEAEEHKESMKTAQDKYQKCVDATKPKGTVPEPMTPVSSESVESVEIESNQPSSELQFDSASPAAAELSDMPLLSED